MNTNKITNKSIYSATVFSAKLTTFGQLGHISGQHIDFQNSWNGFNNHNRQENINCATLKYRVNYYGRHTEVTQNKVKTNRC